MLHPYYYEMLHKSDHRERVQRAENERLITTLSYPTANIPAMQVLSGLVSKWWANRWRMTNQPATHENTVVVP